MFCMKEDSKTKKHAPVDVCFKMSCSKRETLLCRFWLQLRCTLSIDTYEFSAATLVFKLYETLDQSKQGVVLAAADIVTGLPFRTALACQDIAAQHTLTAKLFKTEPLRIRIAAVSR